MKAVRLNDWQQPLQIEEMPQPIPQSDEVLVRVHAAGLNPFDTAVCAGYLSFMAAVPLTVGTDFAGDVVAVGADMHNFAPGDAVYGSAPLGGTFAEFVTVKAQGIAHKPRSLDYLHSAAIPLPAMAAWQSLFDKAQFQPGERVLIIGAAGSVGSLAVQLAKAQGAFVYGADIAEKAQFIQDLGIDRFIDTKAERFEDIVTDVDIVLDYVGGEFTERAYSVLKPGGRYVTSMVMEPPQDEPARRGIRSMGLGAYPRAELLEKVAELVDAGKLKITVNRCFPLLDVAAAMDYRLNLSEPGKVVLTLV